MMNETMKNLRVYTKAIKSLYMDYMNAKYLSGDCKVEETRFHNALACVGEAINQRLYLVYGDRHCAYNSDGVAVFCSMNNINPVDELGGTFVEHIVPWNNKLAAFDEFGFYTYNTFVAYTDEHGKEHKSVILGKA